MVAYMGELMIYLATACLLGLGCLGLVAYVTKDRRKPTLTYVWVNRP